MEDEDRRQFNVLLPAALIRRLKITAINRDQSLSRFVEEALQDWLDRGEHAAAASAVR